MLNFDGEWSSNFDNVASFDQVDDGLYIGGILNQDLEPFMQVENAYPNSMDEFNTSDSDIFRKNHCINGKLMNKTVPVRLDMTEHIYPEVTFTDSPCNTCSKTCGFSITTSKIQKEEDLKPIYSKNQ
jgi:hypothetical protein